MSEKIKRNKTKENKRKAREKRIKAEYERLSERFIDLEEDTREIVDGLIHRAAFMRVTLEDYEKDINLNGSIEMFSQSESQEPYERARPIVNFYNTQNKNYQSIIKQLVELLPKEQAANEMEAIMNGLQKPQ